MIRALQRDGQGLNELVKEKDAEVAELRARVERLETLARAALAE